MNHLRIVQTIAQLDEAIESHAIESHPILAAAWRRRAVAREAILRSALIHLNEPIEHSGRVFALDLDGTLRIMPLEVDHEHVTRNAG